ncbi:MAG: DUF1186 domain-containing protein [Planctomycetia bacterium]|nr:DUF1186 domain-containing protein [Planctomycetia bacterium]
MDDSDHAVASQSPGQPSADDVVQEHPPEVWTIDEIVAALDRNCQGMFPEQAIRAAQQRRDEMIPRLIDLIRNAMEIVRAGSRPTGDGVLFALYLLTEFRAAEALPTILESLSLPNDGAYELYSDAITEVVGRLLAALMPNSPDVVDGLIANRSLDSSVRWEAAHAYLYWARDGRLTREQGVEALQKHLREAISKQDVDICSGLVCELTKYSPREALKEIKNAYSCRLVDEFLVQLSDVETSIAEGDSRWQTSLQNCRPTGVVDTVEELSDWYYFQSDDNSADSDDFDEPIPVPSRFLDDEQFSPDDNLLDAADDEWGDVAPIDSPDTIRHTRPRVGRNEPCPCGSGRKFKKCCGKN